MVIPTVAGILGPSIASSRTAFKALLSTEPWLRDPEVLPIPYRSQAEISLESPPDLSFGIFATDGIVTPHPPITRAIREVSEALKAAGHKVNPFPTLALLNAHHVARSSNGTHPRMLNRQYST